MLQASRLPHLFLLLTLLFHSICAHEACLAERPNVLVAISDDQSYPHASAYGYAAVRTPAFDRVARLGVLFHNAFTPAPGCSPMRAAFLTGRNVWQIEHAGTHASSFPAQYEGFQSRLEKAGYVIGHTGKGWRPGNLEASGRTRNPAGPEFSDAKAESPAKISQIDYAENFAGFLKSRPDRKPFSFWFGAFEPHRGFRPGIGREHGGDPARVVVPPFLPDLPEVRSDILDYCYEVEWFDRHLGRMLELLEKRGELENTLVIVTSDNGMAFPRAKANVYEFGIHMPLAIAWPARVAGGRTVDDLVNLIDVTATIYEATGAGHPSLPLAGNSLLSLLASGKSGIVEREREAVFSGRERHSSSRFNSLGYPQRCIRTRDFLYIRNFRPERWPAGAPRKLDAGGQLGPEHVGYHDIDKCPTLSLLVARRDDPKVARYLELAVGRRPAEELYHIGRDPGCLTNLASHPEFEKTRRRLGERLLAYLRQTGDPRVTGPDFGDIFETYPRYSGLRWFPRPAWADEQPERVPVQPWLEAKRP